MRYISTRDKNINISASEAIATGLSRDGGLFTPELMPLVGLDEIAAMCRQSYFWMNTQKMR